MCGCVRVGVSVEKKDRETEQAKERKIDAKIS